MHVNLQRFDDVAIADIQDFAILDVSLFFSSGLTFLIIFEQIVGAFLGPRHCHPEVKFFVAGYFVIQFRKGHCYGLFIVANAEGVGPAAHLVAFSGADLVLQGAKAIHIRLIGDVMDHF